MKRSIQIWFCVLLIPLILLAACAPGHDGSKVVAFIRDGQLWTIDPNGANAFGLVAQGTPVVGYNWSPDHRLLAYRALDEDFAKTPAAKQLGAHPITGQIGDAPSTANTIGVDGGTPTMIAFSDPAVLYSNAMWSPNSTRLLYRQTGTTPPTTPDLARWWISQNDQPGGIAIKTFPGSYSIPSVSYDDKNFTVIGNTSAGLFTTNLTGTDQRYLQRDPISGHPLPATLERVLWQPGHQNASVLYAVQLPSFAARPLEAKLVQRSLNGQITELTNCSCTQFAWSPDGNKILYSTATSFTVLNLSDHSSFEIQVNPESVPYWSPDGRFLLLNGRHNLTLVNISTRQQSTLLSDGETNDPPANNQDLPANNALLQPVPNSLWGADSRQFVFTTQQRLLWQGQPLKSGKGLYIVTIDSTGKPQGTPVQITGGDVSQAGWTYQDPNSSFLY